MKRKTLPKRSPLRLITPLALPIPCLACGGRYEKEEEREGSYMKTTCRFCDDGFMNLPQQERYRAYQRSGRGH